MCKNCVDGICQNKCVPQEQTQVCDRCSTPVLFNNVTDGYFAYCPKHDEDLFKCEVTIITL